VLILSQGVDRVLAALAALGLGGLWITLVRALEISGAGCAWWVLLPQPRRELIKVCIGLRFLREAVNTLLPVAQIGGEIIGARLLSRWRVSGGLAAASLLVDLLVQVATQLIFCLLGIVLLAHLGGEGQLITYLSLGLALMALGVLGFFATQRLGGFHLIERLLLRIAAKARWDALASVANL